MRVVISGTHGVGKSTLIGDFSASHREWTVLPDPYEFIDAAEESPGSLMFFHQLRIAAARLLEPATGHVLAERGPLDFLAYLHALDSLDRPGAAGDVRERGYRLARLAMAEVDLLILLPLSGCGATGISAEEDLELREAMDQSLWEFADDPDLVGATRVVEIVGSREQRLARLEVEIDGLEVAALA